MVMTLEEAAKVLGLSPNADKNAVNASYRKLVAKYHPDANRNKSPQEQKQAEVMFKKVAQARKIMLDPSKAATATPQQQPQTQQYRPQQEKAQQPQWTQRPQQRQSQYQQTQTRTYQQTQTRTQQAQAQAPRTTRTHYNNAQTFQDNIPHEVDLPERQLKNVYKKDIRANYHKAQDAFRISPSMIISILTLLYSALMIVSNEAGFAALNFDNVYVLVFCAAVVKFVVYDMLISYYVMKPVKEIGFGWLMTAGVEAILVAIALFIFTMVNGTADPMFLTLLIIGVIFISASLAKRTDKKKN